MDGHMKVLRSPWRWLLIATSAFFAVMAYDMIVSASDMPTEADVRFFRLVGVATLVGSLTMGIVSWRKRVVLREDEMLVCWGVRARRYPREEIVGAKYGGGQHEVAKYGIGYPVVVTADGNELSLKFLAERERGGGLRRVENNIGDINDWARQGSVANR